MPKELGEGADAAFPTDQASKMGMSASISARFFHCAGCLYCRWRGEYTFENGGISPLGVPVTTLATREPWPWGVVGGACSDPGY